MTAAMLPETLAMLKMRRSPKLRDLQEPAPTHDQLTEILTIASRVPDHGKLVPWRFVVIRGERRDHLNGVIGDRFDAVRADGTDEQREESRRRMTYAPLVIAVVVSPREHPKVPELEQTLTVGAVCMNLILAAKAHGFAALWLTEWYAFDPVVCGELGLGAHERIAGFMHIGTASDGREDRERPSLGAIVSEY